MHFSFLITLPHKGMGTCSGIMIPLNYIYDIIGIRSKESNPSQLIHDLMYNIRNTAITEDDHG